MREKADWLAKGIAIFQALWFAATVVTRLVGIYQISLLEDMTIAYAACGLVMFICWFRCPQGLMESLQVPSDPGKRMAAYQDRDAPDRSELDVHVLIDMIIFIIAAALLSVFVGIHLGAWHYPFPSIPEALWRAANLSGGVFGGNPFYTIMRLDLSRRMVDAAFKLNFLIYILCRAIVFALALAAFRRSPASVYENASWSVYWGHVGA